MHNFVLIYYLFMYKCHTGCIYKNYSLFIYFYDTANTDIKVNNYNDKFYTF